MGPNMEMIWQKGWKIKLAGLRKSDGFESITKFDFKYVPEDFYVPCIFCDFNGDDNFRKAALPDPIGPARPGVKKRRMPESTRYKDAKRFNESGSSSNAGVQFRFGRDKSSSSLLDSMPALDKLLDARTSSSASQSPLGSLKLKPLSSLQKTYTTLQNDDIVTEVGKSTPPLIPKKSLNSMPDLIDLNLLKSIQRNQDFKKQKEKLVGQANNMLGYQEKNQEDLFRASLERLVKKSQTDLKKNDISMSSRFSPEIQQHFIRNEKQHTPANKNIQHFMKQVQNVETVPPDQTSLYEIKIESDEDVMEPETTQPNSVSRDKLEKISQNQSTGIGANPVRIENSTLPVKRSNVFRKQTIESMLKEFGASQIATDFDFMRNSLSPESRSELDNLDNLDILDKVFHPLPPALNDVLDWQVT